MSDFEAIARAVYEANKLSHEPEWTIVDACYHASAQECLDESESALVELVVTFCPQAAITKWVGMCGVPSEAISLPMPDTACSTPTTKCNRGSSPFSCTIDEPEDSDEDA